jgi:FixJ family two-component response regulator
MIETDGHQPTIYVVEDDEAERRSLAWLLQAIDLRIKVFATATDFLAAYTPGRPGCLVLDVWLPGTTGLDLQEQLARAGDSLPLILLTAYPTVGMATKAMRAGAADFLEKPVPPDVLLVRVRAVLQRDAQERAERLRRDQAQQRLRRLTQREREVLAHVVAGKPNKVTALQLDLSTKTIEAHRAKIVRKTGARSVADLVRLVQLAGLVEVPNGR